MSRTIKVFSPIENKTITYAASAAEQHVTYTSTISLGATFLQGSSSYFPDVLEIDNQTDKPIAVKASASAVGTAAVFTTDFEVKNGDKRYINVGQNDYISVIPSASATGAIYLARGIGGV